MGPPLAQKVDEETDDEARDHGVVRQEDRVGAPVEEPPQRPEGEHRRERERSPECGTAGLASRPRSSEEHLRRRERHEHAQHERESVVRRKWLDDRGDVRDGDDRPREAGGQSPGRVRKVELHERPAVEEERGLEERAEEPRASAEDHEEADAAGGTPGPGDEPGDEQHPSHGQVGDGKAAAEVVVGRQLGGRAERQADDEQPEPQSWHLAGDGGRHRLSGELALRDEAPVGM